MRLKLGMQRGELERSIALEVARREIAARIRGVCADFGEVDFAALVERMAEIEVRYRLRDDWPFPREGAARGEMQRA